MTIIQNVRVTSTVQMRRSSSTNQLNRRFEHVFGKRRLPPLSKVRLVALFALAIAFCSCAWYFPGNNGRHVQNESSAAIRASKLKPELRVVSKRHPAALEPRALEYGISRDLPGHRKTLAPPPECQVWRSVAQDRNKLHLYRKHFASLDATDWLIYTAIFDESFHARATRAKRRPRYVDVGASRARRWSGSYFLDRCMGWDGVCVEQNPKYFEELSSLRHCRLVEKCVAEAERMVNFSFADAYGGVVKDEARHIPGVNVTLHKGARFEGHFDGVRSVQCTTLAKEVRGAVDFATVDADGYELQVLLGVDWEATVIDVLVVEGASKSVRELMRGKGYRWFRAMRGDLFVRNASGLAVNTTYLQWLHELDGTTYKFTKGL